MLFKEIDQEIVEREHWALRRQLGIPNNRRLFVLACMDERLPVYQALGIEEGDAHVFRNAGGLVTDDAIRSAMLTTNFFGTKEIIIINHTECGMMSATGDYLAEELSKKVDLGKEPLNPAVPELKLEDQKKNFAKWIQMFNDVDATSVEQAKLMRESAFIPKDVVIHNYIWEVESMSLRKPYGRLSNKVNTAQEMSKSKLCKNCNCLHLENAKCACPAK